MSARIEDAYLYLHQVKTVFKDRPQIYDDFLHIMKTFKAKKIDVPEAKTLITRLFEGHTYLIQGFNTFLPRGSIIEISIPTKDADDSKHQCAACGDSDDGGGSLEACTACNLVKDCNRTCQVAHRPAHKKACKERAAELFDEKLFKQPSPNEDCPICYLRLPIDEDQFIYQSCCGKMLCDGCVCANTVAAADTERFKCVFCRSEGPSSDEEDIERMKKRVEANDALAMYNLGSDYQLGMKGLRQDNAKALELYHKSAKLGNNIAHFNLSVCYQTGSIVEIDTRKATYHRQLAAMAGDVQARYNLGCEEGNASNMDRAYKHWMISANDGYDLSMKAVQEGYQSGFVTKDDYEKTTRTYGNSIDEMKSDDRDRAAAFRTSMGIEKEILRTLRRALGIDL
jgi:TPR repeat protein